MRLLFAWRPRTTRSSGNWRLLPPTVSDRRRYVVSIQGQQGLGPEIGVPIPLGKKAVLLLRFRYLWEFSARSNTQGQTLHFSVTMPLAQFQ